MQLIKKLATSPYMTFSAGVVLFISGLTESWQQYQELESIRFGVHHGVILFSLVQMIKGLPDIFEGLGFIGRTPDEK
jgi:hypothetical protein